jgi:hypothetical protein
MYPTRRGRQGIAALAPPGPHTTPGPDVSDRSVAQRVSELGLTVATLTPKLEERINQLLDEVLTRGQFGEILFELITYACALEKEQDTRLLALVLDLTFQRLKDNPQFDIYHCNRFFQAMANQILPTLHDKMTLDSDGKPIQGVGLFLKYLLDRFHLAVDETWKTRESAVLLAGRSPEDAKTAAMAIKRWINLEDFAYTMWGGHVIKEPVVHGIIEKQISATGISDSEIIKLAGFIKQNGRFATTCGSKDRLDEYYTRIHDMVKSGMFSSGSRQMISVCRASPSKRASPRQR